MAIQTTRSLNIVHEVLALNFVGTVGQFGGCIMIYETKYVFYIYIFKINNNFMVYMYRHCNKTSTLY
jgi:hypothetical protein